MIRAVATGIELDIIVTPRASAERVGPTHDNRLKVAVTKPAVDGAANRAVIALLAKRLGVTKSAITVVRGLTSKRKTLLIAGLSDERARELALP